MTRQHFVWIIIAIALWGVLVAVKSIVRIRDGKPYVLGWWDSMRRQDGKLLPPTAMYLRVALAVALCAAVYAFTQRALGDRNGMYTIVGLALAIGLTGQMAEDPR